MSSLYETTREFLALKEMIEEDVDPQLIADTMEAIEGEFEYKAEAYAKIITDLDGDADKLLQESARLDARAKTIQSNIKAMKKALQDAMWATGKTKFKTGLFSFNIQKNPARLVFVEGKDIPAEFMIPQPDKVDNQAIKLALKNGEEFDFARLEQSESLRIR